MIKLLKVLHRVIKYITLYNQLRALVPGKKITGKKEK